MIKGKIEITPISVNRIFQGRRFRTAEFKKWQKDLLNILPKSEVMLTGQLGIKIDFYFPNANRSDLDNLFKGIFDCFQKRAYFKNDNQINYIEARKFKSDNIRIEFEIFQL